MPTRPPSSPARKLPRANPEAVAAITKSNPRRFIDLCMAIALTCHVKGETHGEGIAREVPRSEGLI
jgi:hypothetical protein